ncbi:nitroreductase family protein [Fulvivirga maritima]|uniref:nitroreductase family protein n=1 Tax=Fulvivirga maritima TaxID=2904247 RepID=UPI001F47D796|nr:nitroreductase family protein [Fulvivirga maritima]UII26659.1 nitroreductase family protein [Fulvivirga maritima]
MTKKTIIGGYPFIPYQKETYSEAEVIKRSQEFHSWLDLRRSVREFSDKPIPKTVIENLILSASTAPSGAHKQPWTFCAVSNKDLKQQIRIAAEKEEKESYESRMSKEWLNDLKPLQTDWQKAFLEIAPYLIVVFKKAFELQPDGSKKNYYYVNESVGLATGLLLAAIHNAGLVALTHTPSPMNFLTDLLKRPTNERPFLLIPVGYPKEETLVPDIKRKKLEEVSVFYE